MEITLGHTYRWHAATENNYIKLEAHVHNITKYDDVCVAGAVRELCEVRDSLISRFVNPNQLNSLIYLLCIK